MQVKDVGTRKGHFLNFSAYFVILLSETPRQLLVLKSDDEHAHESD